MTSQKHFKSWFRLLGAAFAYFFFLVIAVLLFTSNTAKAASAPGEWKDPSAPQCQWQNSANVRCEPNISFGTNYADYYFDPESTLKAGHLVFRASGDQGALDEWGYLHFINNDVTVAYITTSPTDATGGYKQDPASNYQAGIDNKNDPIDNTRVCSLQGGQKDANCILGFTKDTTKSKPSMPPADYLKAVVIGEQTQSGSAEADAASEHCTNDAGKIGFVLCPIMETTNSAVKALIGSDGKGKGFLVELLTIQPLESGTPIYKGWEGIRNVALGLYILVFVLIIFGNGVGYDPYTIKRALPRLAVGVLLTFASFFIVQTLVDLSNIVGNAIPSFIASLSGQAGVANYSINFSFGVASIAIILWIVLLFVALAALLVGIAGLIARVIIIYALVLLAPIAFVAWVLPNTENLFKKWWQNLIKVLMMFPIVTGMLAIAIFFQGVILSQGPSGNFSADTAALVAAVAPLIALIMIPKTFKWGGDAFAAAAGFAAGKMSGISNAVSNAPKSVGGKAVGSTKDRVMASDRVAKMSGNLAAGAIAGKLGGKAALRASGRTRAKLSGEAEGLTKNMTEDQLEKIARAGTYEERVAAIGQLAKRKSRGKLANLAKDGGKTGKAFNDASGRYAGDWGPNADLRRIGGKFSNISDMSMEDAAGLNADAFAVGLASGSISYATAQKIHGNDKTRATLTPQKLHDLTTYLNAADKSVAVEGKDSRDDAKEVIGTRTTTNGRGQKVTFANKQTLSKQLETTAVHLRDEHAINPTTPPIADTIPINAAVDDPPEYPSPPTGPIINRAAYSAGKVIGRARSNMGQGGYVDLSQGASTGANASVPVINPAPGSTVPPTPSGAQTRPSSPVRPVSYTPPTNPGSAPFTDYSALAPQPGPMPPSGPVPPAPTPVAPTYSPGSSVIPAPAPTAAAPTTSASPGSTIINNVNTSTTMYTSSLARNAVQAAGSTASGYNDLIRRMDNIDGMLNRGRVDSGLLKKELKSLHMGMSGLPSDARGPIDSYMREVERSSGIEERGGDHDVDLGGE